MIIIEEQSSLSKRAKFSRRTLRSSRRIVLSLMPNELTPWLNQLFCIEGTKVIYLNSGVKQKGDECMFPHSLPCQSHELERSTSKNWCYGEFKTRASCCYTFLSWNLFTTALRKTFQQALHRVTDITSRNLFGNVETGLEMLFSSAPLLWTSTLAMIQSRVVFPFSDWFTQRSITRARPEFHAILAETRHRHSSVFGNGVT